MGQLRSCSTGVERRPTQGKRAGKVAFWSGHKSHASKRDKTVSNRMWTWRAGQSPRSNLHHKGCPQMQKSPCEFAAPTYTHSKRRGPREGVSRRVVDTGGKGGAGHFTSLSDVIAWVRDGGGCRISWDAPCAWGPTRGHVSRNAFRCSSSRVEGRGKDEVRWRWCVSAPSLFLYHNRKQTPPNCHVRLVWSG